METHMGFDAGAALWLPLGGVRKCSKFVLKKLKAFATFITQCITSVLVVSVLLNSVMVPSLETVVVLACEKLIMAGTAGVYWVQSCSAWTHTRAEQLCTSKLQPFQPVQPL